MDGIAQNHRPQIDPPFSVGLGVWPCLRDASIAVVLLGADVFAIRLAIIHGIWWPAIGAFVLFLFAVLLLAVVWKRPLYFSFGRETITVRKLAGLQCFRCDRLDAIRSIPDTHFPRLILRFSDGGRLSISKNQIKESITELSTLLEQRLTSAIITSVWPRFQDYLMMPRAFGPGSVLPFSAYLEKQSSVQTSSIEDVIVWLRGCEFVSDEEQFCKADVWQHPVDFEQVKKGDCEDHALWAWRKLVELHMEAEFVVGTMDGVPHAWVTFEHEGSVHLMETTRKVAPMVFPAHQMRKKYRPLCSVNRYLVTYRYSTTE